MQKFAPKCCSSEADSTSFPGIFFRIITRQSPPYIHPLHVLQDDHAIDVARDTSGTSINLGGDFALSLGGSRSQYLPSNATARDVKLALEALDTVGTVDVERNDGDAEVRQNRTVTGICPGV